MTAQEIKEHLVKNGVTAEIVITNLGEEVVTRCPRCDAKPLAGGSYYTQMNIQPTSGNCVCNGPCQSITDLKDYFKAMGLPELTQIKNNVVVQPASQTSESKIEPRFWTLDELVKHNFGPQDWIIEKLIPVNAICMLSGVPQSYKTWITLEIVRSVSTGKKFLGEFVCPKKSPVLVINEEDHGRFLQTRLNLMKLSQPAGSETVYLLTQEGFDLDSAYWIAKVKEFVQAKKVKLIIIDSFIRVHGHDENVSREMAAVFKKLRELTRTLGVSILLTHHHRKAGFGPKDPTQSLRGSSDIGAALDVHLSVDNEDDKLLTISQHKLKCDEKYPPFQVRINRSPDKKSVTFDYVGLGCGKQTQKENAKELITNALAEGEKTGADLNVIAKKEKIGKGAVDEALKELSKSGEIESKNLAHGKKSYKLAEGAD